jgi:Fe-S-cluster containining protein
MECRVGCGACCIAPSLSSAIPGMPHGKPAGVRCVQLTADNHCRLFDQPDRPLVCSRLKPLPEMCGETMEQALAYLTRLEIETLPQEREPSETSSSTDGTVSGPSGRTHSREP